MVAYSERQRVRRLLAEAITMLCKSSLSYKFGFSVEGLIGITLDDSQVILVNINEEITDKSWRENTGTKITSSPTDDPIDLRMGENKHISASAGSSTQHHTNPSDHTQRSDHRDRPARCGKRESTRSRLSNGHGSKKRRVLESPLSTRIKKEDEEEGSKGESGGRSGEGWTPDVVPPPPHSPESVEGQQQDVIFIKDDDSDSDTSVEGDSAPASHHHGNQVPHSPSPGDEDGGGKVLQTSIKVEDEGEEAGRRGSSPIEVTYEAGMWATETAVDGQASTQLHPGQASLHPSPLKSNLTQTPSNEADIGAQPNAQIEMDHTEWPSDPQRRPRASYSTAYKLMVVRRAIESGNMRATARRFGIHFKQVWQWTRNKEKLLAMSLSALRSPRLWPQAESTGGDQETQEKPLTKPPKDPSPD